MLSHLRIENAGPADLLELDLAPRLNLLTGDNGLGKSFILDIIWFLFSGTWPGVLNSKINMAFQARPKDVNAGSAIIFKKQSNDQEREYNFLRDYQFWNIGNYPDNINESDKLAFCFYMQANDNFAIVDSIKNRPQLGRDLRSIGIPCVILSNEEVWNGQYDGDSVSCNGLIRDWASWQKENGGSFEVLEKILRTLSPLDLEYLSPGSLTRVTLGDVRDMPTIKMPYGEVPVSHASSGVRRIIALCYMLAWAWQEHNYASSITGIPKGNRAVLLIDEIDSHLHPKWQRTIVKSLMAVMQEIAPEIQVQIVVATHSPLVMASVEPYFNPEQDAWFDLDLVDGEVKIEKRPWERLGNADAWLKSEAFDQKSGYALETEQAIADADAAMANPELIREQAKEIDDRLHNLLGERDPFWIRWGYFFEDKGWRK